MAIERIMSIGAGQPGPENPSPVPQTGNGEVVSPIPDGMHPKIYETLNRHYPHTFIQEQREGRTHEDFLKSAEEEAKRLDAIKVEEQVRANAVLPEEERLKDAGELLYGKSKELSEQQKQTFLRMHEVGKDRPGAGVYNYNQAEISEKARIGREKAETGEEVFSKEQRRALMEAGLVGTLPTSEVTGLKEDDYEDPILKRFVRQVVHTVGENLADEEFLSETASRIEKQLDDGKIAEKEEPKAFSLIDKLKRLRNKAKTIEPPPPARTPAPETRRSEATRKIGLLQQSATGIYRLEQKRLTQSLTPDEDNALAQARAARSLLLQQATFEEVDLFAQSFQNPTPDQQINFAETIDARDRLLEEARRNNLIEPIKRELFSLFYGSRVKVSNKQKEGLEDYEGHGILDQLRSRLEEAKQRKWEERSRFWSDPQRKAFETRFRGILDYVNEEGISLIYDVVNNRHEYPTPDSYPDNGLYKIWQGEVRDKKGKIVKDEEGKPIKAEDFDDIRDTVEEARLREAWVSSRGDYETWIQFVAEDVQELKASIPYIVARVKRKRGTGEPNSVYQRLVQEKDKLDAALAVFPTETEGQFRRFKSILTGEINLMGAHFFSDLVRKDWQPLEHFSDALATATQDTEDQDHLVDSLILDEDGLTMLALDEYSKNDGEFWRYAQKETKDTPKLTKSMQVLFMKQAARKKEIEATLLEKRLKPMQVLLNTHPAFQRLKVLHEALDNADKAANIPLVDSDGNPKSRWQEYTEKSLRWEETEGQEFVDPRDGSQRVIFQHPLARAFRPKGFRDENGKLTDVDEFQLMFETDTRKDKLYIKTKKRKIKRVLEKSEKLARAFMQDSAAALARHTFDNVHKKIGSDGKEIQINGQPVWESPYGKIILDQNGDPAFLEVTPDIKLAIKSGKDKKGKSKWVVDEAVPHTTLIRSFCDVAIQADRNKTQEKMLFKLNYILQQKLGLDIDSPLLAAWYLGAHDTGRPVLLDYIYQVPGFKDILERNEERRDRKVKLKDGRDDPTAADEKTTVARWAEGERRFKFLMEYVIKQKIPKYFNWPGQDTRGAGQKDTRNHLSGQYGTSTDSVEINGLINELMFGVGDFASEFGCTKSPWKQLVGLFKGPNEVVFADTGNVGFIENPRDTETWVKRFFKGAVGQNILFTKGKEGSHGLLNDGPFSGMYLFRVLNRGLQGTFEDSAFTRIEDVTADPEKAYKKMYESLYKAYVQTAGEVIKPLATVMHERMNSIDSTFGRNPGSAMFLNTMLWYGVSKWMDQNWGEFRGKFGFALDGDLHLARKFMSTYLKESRLIYSDKEWDEIVLGYTRVENENGSVQHIIRYKVDNQGQTVEVEHDPKTGRITKIIGERSGEKSREVHEGLLDSFPDELRKEIIDNRWLPFGLDTDFPETLDVIMKENLAETGRDAGSVYGSLRQKAGTTRGRKEIVRS